MEKWSLLRSARQGTISRGFRLTQLYWVYVYACGGSYHLPSLPFSLPPPPPLPLSLQYLCSSLIPSQAGGRLTSPALQPPLPLMCSLFLTSAPPPPPSMPLPALEQLMCLLPHCFTAIALPQFSRLHRSPGFLLPDNHGRVWKTHYRKRGRGRRERRGRAEPSSFQLLHSSVCPSQPVISCTLWTQYWKQLVGRELPEGIHPHMSASISVLFWDRVQRIEEGGTQSRTSAPTLP